VSSSTYSAELEPDTVLRAFVVLSGIGLSVIGVLLILLLPLHPVARVVGSGAWLYASWWEIATLVRGFTCCGRLQMAVGGLLTYLDRNGHWCGARLLPGSAVLPRLAWIRYETEGGHRSAELLRGNCRESGDWRRLQVIWRHIGATV